MFLLEFLPTDREATKDRLTMLIVSPMGALIHPRARAPKIPHLPGRVRKLIAPVMQLCLLFVRMDMRIPIQPAMKISGPRNTRLWVSLRSRDSWLACPWPTRMSFLKSIAQEV
jgi:hypothetical protein